MYSLGLSTLASIKGIISFQPLDLTTLLAWRKTFSRPFSFYTSNTSNEHLEHDTKDIEPF